MDCRRKEKLKQEALPNCLFTPELYVHHLIHVGGLTTRGIIYFRLEHIVTETHRGRGSAWCALPAVGYAKSLYAASGPSETGL
jgi:hypothetical protein